MATGEQWLVQIGTLGHVSGGTMVWRFRGSIHVTVIVKASFALVPGSDMVQIEPDPIVRAEIHYRNSPNRSVRLTSDLAPYLDRVDVLLTGHAYAPPGQTTTMQPVRLAIYRDQILLDKTLHIYGDRKLDERQPFDKIPLQYERAFGGIGWEENPLGIGFKAKAPSGVIIHNIVDPTDPRRTEGFGPISRTWPARKRLLGKGNRSALDTPIADLPHDMNRAYFQSAPRNQQIAYLTGDEWILLEGMHPTLRTLSSRLPDVHAVARIFGLPGAAPSLGNPVALRADTLRIDGDAMQCSVVWRGAIPADDEAGLRALSVVAGLTLRGQPLQWPEMPPVVRPPEALATSIEELDASDMAVTLVRPENAVLPSPELPVPSANSPPPLDTPNLIALTDGISPMASTAEIRPQGRRPRRVDASPSPPASQGWKPYPEPPPPNQAASGRFSATVTLSPEDEIGAAGSSTLPFAEAERPSASASPRSEPLPGAPWSSIPAEPVPIATAFAETMVLDVDESHDSPPALPKASSFFHQIPHPESPPSPAEIPRRKCDTIPIIGSDPFAALTLPWQAERGHDIRVVIVKATFDIVPGGPVAMRQEPDLFSGDVFAGEGMTGSLLYPSDFALFKPKADVVLVGHAFAPGGSAAASEVRFRFGRGTKGFERRLVVFGDRRWETTGITPAPTAPGRFDKIPLRYEYAFGGPEFDKNPLGAGHSDSAAGPRMLPNLERPDELIAGPGDTPDPAGFGALPMLWDARWSRLGTYDSRWLKTRWPYFPDDFDWRHFQAAPPEQQIDYPAGDESFDLAGMSRVHPIIQGKLAGIRPRCFAQKTTEAGGSFAEVLLRLDTVIFDADSMKLNLVWRGLVEVADDDASDIAELFITKEDPGEPRLGALEVHRRYQAATAKLAPIPEHPDGGREVANDSSILAEPLHPHEVRIRERLRKAGIPETPLGPLPRTSAPVEPPAEPTPPRTYPPPHLDPIRREVVGRLATNAPLDGAEFEAADLSDLDFSGRSLVGTSFRGSLLRRARFAKANLVESLLAGADLTEAVLDGAILDRADLTEIHADGASFAGARLYDTDLGRARGKDVSFRAATGARASFAGATLPRARFDQTEIDSADFTGAMLDEAVFDGANLPEIRLYDARGSSVSFKQARMREARADGVCLLQSSFEKAVAPGSVWDRAVLEGSSFFGAVLTASGFARAACVSTIFSCADLRDSRLGRANLTGASLLRCNLMGASLESADLTGADLRGANLHAAETWKAKLDGTDLDLAIVTQSKLKERS